VWHFRPAANDVTKFYAGFSTTASTLEAAIGG
jgi:hypothetical protein